MEHYQRYKTEDFVQDEAFRVWVLSPVPVSNQFWSDFLAAYPSKHTEVSHARALLLAMDGSGVTPTEQQGSQMWGKIEAAITEDDNRSFTPLWQRVFLRRWMPAAAAVLIGFSVWWWSAIRDVEKLPATYEAQVAQQKALLIEHVNRTKESKRVVLPDGSVAMLSTDSKLSLEKDFAGNQRKVYLSGQGYFEVVKNETKPFLVVAGDVVTQVIGTRFTVRSIQNSEEVSVSVRSGKVKVFTVDAHDNVRSAKQVFLTANQTATYSAGSGLLTKATLVSPNMIKAPVKYPDFNFENTAIANVFSTLEESYGVTIEYDENVIASCDITAQLGGEPLFKKLDIICRTIDATYEVWGNKIIITGKGCAAY